MPIKIKYWTTFFAFIVTYSCKPSIKFPATGGYSYPEKINTRDTGFFPYQLIDSLPTKDSFLFGLQGKAILSCFNEQNLSLRPLGKIIFRMMYDSWYKLTIITLTENKIIVKRTIKGHSYPLGGDTSKLTPLERFHYNVLKWNFPIAEKKLKVKYRKSLDSLTEIYPELLKPAYYEYLIKKSDWSEGGEFEYTTTEIPITYKTFARLVNLFNSSGFWNLPHELKCENEPTDAEGFILEANTPTKYKIVSACPYDKSKFHDACSALVKYAGLNKTFDFDWDNAVKASDSIDIQEVPLDTLPIQKHK